MSTACFVIVVGTLVWLTFFVLLPMRQRQNARRSHTSQTVRGHHARQASRRQRQASSPSPQPRRRPARSLDADEAASEAVEAAALPRHATDREVLTALGPGSKYDDVAVLMLDEAEDVLGGFESHDDGEYIRTLLDTKVLYGSWCCSRTNFHHPGATAFFNRPAKLPTGQQATERREKRGW